MTENTLDSKVTRLSTKARLISPDGSYLHGNDPGQATAPTSAPVVATIAAAPIVRDDCAGWKSSLDCLRELVHDIEIGRISEPELVYVSLVTRNRDNPELTAKPSYCWAQKDMAHTRLLFAGLLEHHKISVLTE